jgi:HSP90 family molecular chaperone
MERLLKRMGQPMDPGGFKRTLELNRDHPVVKKLAELQKPMRTSRRSKHTRGCC